MAQEEGVLGRGYRFFHGLKTLKREPQERSQSATWLRRLQGIENVTRVQQTLKTEAFKSPTGKGRQSGLRVRTDSLELICAVEEKPHERQSHRVAG